MATPVPESHLDQIRYAELCAVRSIFHEHGKVLEIGGGNGYQAAVLASWGFDVTSIDVDTEGVWTRRHFNVTEYDGKLIPVGNGAIDVVFSSNVLEHVSRTELGILFSEMRRVLALGGIAVHILPSPVWRFWTMMAHYPWLISRLFRDAKTGFGIGLPTFAESVNRRGLLSLLKRACWPAPHGEYPSSGAELFAFRENVWRKRFETGGFEIISSHPIGIFYTGYTVIPSLPMSWRRFLAKLLGSACKIYVVRPANQRTI